MPERDDCIIILYLLTELAFSTVKKISRPKSYNTDGAFENIKY